MAYTITTQPQSQTVVPGQNTNFSVSATTSLDPLSSSVTYAWYTSAGNTVTNVAGHGATNNTFVFDPQIGNNGLGFFATVNGLSADAGQTQTLRTTLTSNLAILTVNEDVAPYDVQDVWPETGRERHTRLRLLGYI